MTDEAYRRHPRNHDEADPELIAVKKLLAAVGLLWVTLFAGNYLLNTEIGQNVTAKLVHMMKYPKEANLLLGYFAEDEYTEMYSDCERHYQKQLIVSRSVMNKLAYNVKKVKLKKLSYTGYLSDEFQSLLEPNEDNDGTDKKDVPDRNSYSRTFYLGTSDFFQRDSDVYTRNSTVDIHENKFQKELSDFNGLINIQITKTKLCDEISKLRNDHEIFFDDCMIVVERLLDYILTQKEGLLVPKCFKWRVQRILLVSDQEFPNMERDSSEEYEW